MQMARSLNPNTNMAQDTGLAQATPVTPTQAPQPQAPQMMSDGGIMRLQTGGSISAIANLKVNHPEIYEEYKGNPESLAMAAEYFLNVAETPAQTGLEQLETPRENDFLKRMFSDPTRGDIIDQQKRDAAEFGADYALDQSDQSLINQQQAELAGNEMLFAEGQLKGRPAEYLTGNVSAGIGGSAVPMPGPDQPFTGGLASRTAPELSADPVISTSYIGGDPRAVDDASDFSNDPRRGAARPLTVPGMGDVLPETSIANARADADRDELMRYLRGEGTDDEMGFVDGVIEEAAGEDGTRMLSTRNLRDPSMSMDNPIGRLMFGTEPGSSPRQDMNRRAKAYMQSDMYTPPEQIYTLNSPLDLLKYEEAGDDEFTAVSDILARGAAAGEQSSSEASLVARDAASDAPMLDEIARQAESRRMRRINEIPETGYKTLAQKQSEADSPFMTGVVDPIFENMIAGAGYAGRTAADLFEYGAENLPGYVEEMQYARGFGPRAERERADAAEETLMDMPVRVESPLDKSTAAQSEASRRAADSMFGTGITSVGGRRAAPTTTDTTKGTTTDKVASTDVGSSGRIAKMLEDRQKSAESDKWMALAQTGLALMASDQPTLGGAIGEAGLAGIGALQQSRQGMQDFEMDMLKLQTQIDAANRKSGSKGGLTAGNIISYVDDLARQQSDVRDKLDELETGVFMGTDEQKEAIRKRLQTNLFQVGLELSTYRNALRGGQPSSGSAFDVTGGSQSTGN
jgi:hypothetical protein